VQPVLPAPEFLHAAKGYGISTFEASEDGRVRDYAPSLHFGKALEKHLISAVSEGVGGKAPNEEEDQVPLGYGIQPQRALHLISAYDLTHPEDSGLDLKAEGVTNNIVIVGPFDSYSPDLFTSPMTEWHGGVIRGSELLAYGIATASEDSKPAEPSEPIGYVLAAMSYLLAWCSQVFLDGPEKKWFFLLWLAPWVAIALASAYFHAPISAALSLVLLAILWFTFWKYEAGRGPNKGQAFFQRTWRWIVLGLIFAVLPAMVATRGLLLPGSLIVAGWILGWEGAELYGLKMEHSISVAHPSDGKVEPKNVASHLGPLPVPADLGHEPADGPV
jgi:hypothetical protein